MQRSTTFRKCSILFGVCFASACYKERIDYVIILPVLTKEEIEAYAQRTQEIRGKRPPLDGDEESAVS